MIHSAYGATNSLKKNKLYTRHTSSCSGLLSQILPNHIVHLCSSPRFTQRLQATRIILGIKAIL